MGEAFFFNWRRSVRWALTKLGPGNEEGGSVALRADWDGEGSAFPYSTPTGAQFPYEAGLAGAGVGVG